MWLVKRGRHCTAQAAQAEQIQPGPGMWKQKYSHETVTFISTVVENATQTLPLINTGLENSPHDLQQEIAQKSAFL